MERCPNCQKTIGDCRMPTTCVCSSKDLRRRIRDLQGRIADMIRAASRADALEQSRSELLTAMADPDVLLVINTFARSDPRWEAVKRALSVEPGGPG